MRVLIAAGLTVLCAPLLAQEQDVVFISLTPCVIFDTRPSEGNSDGPLEAEEERPFPIVGSTANFPQYGGTAGGCGVPGFDVDDQPVAQAIFINYVAIGAAAGGQLKAWAGDKPEPVQGAVVNYQALSPPMNNSNGVITELNQTAEGLADIRLKARGAGVHVRGVILGYFTQDHITGVIAGTGLSGGGTSGTVTLGIADGGVGTQQLAPGISTEGRVLTSAGTSVQWQNPPAGAVGATGPAGATGASGFQLPGAERPPFSVTTIDSAGVVGSYSSITTGMDGFGLISYYDTTNQDLKVAHCLNVACTDATISTVESDGNSGFYSSITIGSDGLGLIAYQRNSDIDLKVAHCSNIECTASTTTVLDSLGSTGWTPSVTIGTDGLPLISYGGADNNLTVAHCDDVQCTSATLSIIDSAGFVGQDSSITVGADGLGLISYYDGTNSDLKVAHCSDVLCSTATITTLDSTGSVGFDTSITITPDQLGFISYHDNSTQNLKVARCSSVLCTTALIATVEPGARTSVTIGSDGHPIISYFSHPGMVKIAHSRAVSSTSFTFTTIDTPGGFGGQSTAITIGSDGMPLISYFDETNGDLKVAHLSNVFGTPFYRRR